MVKIEQKAQNFSPTHFYLDANGLPIEDMADVCEEAHRRTKRECARKKIPMDRIEDGETVYTERAQEIFDRHYDEITEATGI